MAGNFATVRYSAAARGRHFVAYDGDENELVTDRVFALTCGVAAARSLRLISAARHVVVFDPVRARAVDLTRTGTEGA